MRALVTGSLGFAGSHLVEHLVDAGDTVVGVDRRDGDLTDPAVADRLLAAHRPEVVYHLAGAADVGGSWRDPVGTWTANATATLHLLIAARTHAVTRVLLVSSADVYGRVGEDELPLDETSPVRPTSPYAASKLAAEQVAVQAWLGHGLETIRVRAFNHIGPGQSDAFVAPAIAAAIAANEAATADPGAGAGDDVGAVPVGNLAARRDFTDVRDVARAYRLLMARAEPGELYCVCSGTDVAVQDLADELLGMARVPMRLQVEPERFRPVDIPTLRGDHAKLTAATGWLPEIPLTRTLGDLLAERRSHAGDARPSAHSHPTRSTS